MVSRCLTFLGVTCLVASFGCKPEVDATIKTVKSTRVAFIPDEGPYSEAGFVIKVLYGWLKEKEIQPVGAPFGIYYDNPDEIPPEKCRYEVCVPIPDGIEVTSEVAERVGVKELPATEVALLIHKGAYGKVSSSWKRLYSWIYRNKYEPSGPGREIYLNSPDEVPEDSLLTEIQVPVKKK